MVRSKIRKKKYSNYLNIMFCGRKLHYKNSDLLFSLLAAFFFVFVLQFLYLPISLLVYTHKSHFFFEKLNCQNKHVFYVLFTRSFFYNIKLFNENWVDFFKDSLNFFNNYFVTICFTKLCIYFRNVRLTVSFEKVTVFIIKWNWQFYLSGYGK